MNIRKQIKNWQSLGYSKLVAECIVRTRGLAAVAKHPDAKAAYNQLARRAIGREIDAKEFQSELKRIRSVATDRIRRDLAAIEKQRSQASQSLLLLEAQ